MMLMPNLGSREQNYPPVSQISFYGIMRLKEKEEREKNSENLASAI